jgi:uncharacterized protein YeaO (DUF488 family)
MIQLKRAYEGASKSDGARFLVERLWPRGVKKQHLKLDGWLKAVAPSSDLRRWFGHDPEKWSEFRRRYVRELEQHADAWRSLLARVRRGRVTLVYSAHDTEHNNAVVLKDFLELKLTHKAASRRAA